MSDFLRRLATRFGLPFIARARSPILLLLAGAILLIDLVVPDFIPFVDEILLALVTVLLARWKVQSKQP